MLKLGAIISLTVNKSTHHFIEFVYLLVGHVTWAYMVKHIQHFLKQKSNS